MNRPLSSSSSVFLLATIVACVFPSCRDTGPGALGASLLGPAQCGVGEEAVFDAAGSSVSGGAIVEYVFVFGDGSPAEHTLSPRVSHSYAGAGSFQVALRVTDDLGRIARSAVDIFILEDGPEGPCLPVGVDDGPDTGPDTECDPGSTALCGDDLGLCMPGVRLCDRDGQWGPCEGGVGPRDEVCGNRVDDDCDGEVDEDCGDCEPGSERPCGDDVGECAPGVERCANDGGGWTGVCEGGRGPRAELCDGLDNDCDGGTDESLICICDEGEVRRCGDPRGECRQGLQRCAGGEWGPCEGGVGPAPEVCDGLDNDCHGMVQVCEIGGWGACVGARPPTPEECDGRDNDCDGELDEGCRCQDGERRRCGSDVGECVAGIQDCRRGEWTACVGAVAPSAEECDGLDNDCNGVVDDLCDCTPGQVRACGGAVGECRPGRQECVRGGWGPCEGAVLPEPEACDARDNDCDRQTDEGLRQRCRTACGEGVEVCERGRWIGCDAPVPGREVCDARDNDCDGAVDEDLSRTCRGPCGDGTEWCVGGLYRGCDAPEPQPETCNGRDDDCDGAVDEDLRLPPCPLQLGVCAGSTRPCLGARGVGDCGAATYGRAFERRETRCDRLDNDCDGGVDEGCACAPGEQRRCGSNVGACEGGIQSCGADGAWGGCEGLVGPEPERCNGEDDDCDGRTDEDIVVGCRTVCGEGTRECRNGRMTNCSAAEPQPEECNGLDDDCDGEVDEECFCVPGEVRPCGMDVGECEAGYQICVQDGFGPCIGATGPSPEACDGLDNDCDGEVDEVCQCEPGDRQPCGVDTGECRTGEQVCLDVGIWSGCEGAVGPAPEECDGLDNDCDGELDELCPCQPGDRRACGSDVGACREGMQVCIMGLWGPCFGSQGPEPEVCNGEDDDCDGDLDEGCACRAGERRRCGTALGECRRGWEVCDGGEFGPCRGAVWPSPEACDGRDNDCDGEVDNGCACRDGEARACGSNVGACRPGVEACMGGAWGPCEGGTGPSPEACNGEDDDCDAEVDEGIPCACLPGERRGCGSDVGACSEGVQICRNGAWGGCQGAVGPSPEACNGRDDDCDGQTDEGCSCREGQVRPCGPDAVGICRPGQQRCSVAGQWGACQGAVYAGDERCGNGLDDDCDGLADEGCECAPGATRACGISTGACEPGVETCSDRGRWGPCQGRIGPSAEVCDAEDNDCDGVVDEGCGCLPGEVQTCGPDPVGICQPGLMQCSADGQWGLCEGAVEARRETCNGLDDDCDREVDEGCDCAPGERRACGESVGVCEPGEQRCDAAGSWEPCQGAIGPSAEECNGLDDDCDGAVDEDDICPQHPCGEARVGVEGVQRGTTRGGDEEQGSCGGGGGEQVVAFSAPRGGVWRAHTVGSDYDTLIYARDECLEPGSELACDDDGGPWPTSQLLLPLGVGETAYVFMDGWNGNGSWLLTLEQCPQPELCDEQDNDCDGQTDEDCECEPGATRPCGPEPVGSCRQGVQGCDDMGQWGDCEGAVGPVDEACNGLDDDCNGEIDEVCECDPDEAQECGESVGACEPGIQSCGPDGLWGRCEGGIEPAPEECNGQDDDCDGEADEGCDCLPGEVRECGPDPVGICQPGQQFCFFDGTWGPCFGAVEPQEERCNFEDDDCDGETDEDDVCAIHPCSDPREAVVGVQEGDTVGQDEVRGSCGGRGGEQVLEFTAPRNGLWRVHTVGSDYDTLLHARSDCLDPDTELACNDDGGPELMSQIGLTLEAGETAYLFVDGWRGNGHWMLGIEECPQEEVCDQQDNDCDGQTDEDCGCNPGETRVCGPDPVGVCRQGVERCGGDRAWGPCEGSVEPSDEVCGTGRDEDCDGEVDEGCECAPGQARPCGESTGACEPGVQTCGGDGTWGGCEGGVGPADEECGNGLDDDCNGQVDETCDCRPGERRRCGSDVGECALGVESCANGVWSGVCQGGVGPSAEECNGLDDDCDGEVDEECDCVPGATRDCGVDVGVCEYGEERCGDDGRWGPCAGGVGPAQEECNGLDDDCDGALDEGCDCRLGETRACGPDAVGVCRPGVQGCLDGAWGPCQGAVEPRAEECNGLDDDCDGGVDEDGVCPDGPCDLAVLAGEGVQNGRTQGEDLEQGSCGGAGGEQVLEFVAPAGGVWRLVTTGSSYDTLIYARTDCEDPDSEMACDDDGGPGTVSQLLLPLEAGESAWVFMDGWRGNGDWVLDAQLCPQAEVCDGEDNDCDGQVDEDCDCDPGETRACGPDPVGVCRQGVQACADDGQWGACEGAVEPGDEVCGNALDDDCDGGVDEGCACAPGETRACGSSTGACELGEQVCADDGQWSDCEGGVEPAVEECNGADDDCDGQTDEGCECLPGEMRACGPDPVGRCERGEQVCDLDGQWGICLGAVWPRDERCNNEDDDCDGEVDEDDVCGAHPCGNATPVGEGVHQGATEGADTLRGSCGGRGGEAILEFTAPRDGMWRFDTMGSDYDTLIHARSDCLDPDTELGCDDDGGQDLASQLLIPLEADEAAYVIVDGWNGNGAWTLTIAQCPQAEVCDGQDNDCDGEIDEGCFCDPGDSRVCGPDPVGACRPGVERCGADGTWGACEGAVEPSDEVCGNNLDDDCNGETDETCECQAGVSRGCGTDVGVCVAGVERCDNGSWTGVCEGEVGPEDEDCNGLDDDCDGEEDEV